MLENEALKNLAEQYIGNHIIAGATWIIRKQGKVVSDAHYGFADIKNKIPINNRTVLRLASMTKPITAIGIMLLEEKGLLSIDDPVSKYLPQFKNLKAADTLVGFTEFYEADPADPTKPRMNGQELAQVGFVDIKRDITLRDILSHSSGIGSGPVSLQLYENKFRLGESLSERMDLLASLPLDFQPGEHSAYSATTAFDILGRIIELITGQDYNTFVAENIRKPLGCEDLTFDLTKEQEKRLARLYEGKPDGMMDVSENDESWKQFSAVTAGYYSGSAGLLGTVESYDKVVQMLAAEGKAGEKQFLKEETVRKMSTEASVKHLEMNPGTPWGIAMAICEDPVKAGRSVGKGTFGWSGAYGTHFYIDRENEITVCLGVNCSNIGGADSQFSKDLEKIVLKEFCIK